MSAPRLILVPGLGVDARLFRPQIEAFPDVIVPKWIDPAPRETLAEYAKRLAATVDFSCPVVVGGISFGGMIAMEMARHLPATQIVLIASCREPSAVRGLLRFAERSSRAVPNWLITPSKRLAPLVLGKGGGVPRSERDMLAEMVRDVSVPLLRWGARAIMEWPGCPNPGVPVRHIHGGKDWVIPLSRLSSSPTRIIPSGPHVLNFSHPREVNEFLAETLAM